MPYRPKLFVGIDLDERTRARCAELASRLNGHGVTARFEPPQKLHITVAFLGWIDPQMMESIVQAFRTTASQTPAFTITLDKIGAFPHERNPHVVWIGTRRAPPAFRQLAADIRSAYQEIGFSFEKEPVAHITIARIKQQRVHLPVLSFRPLRMQVKHLTLFDSIPDGRTTRYEVRDRAPLRVT
jgi:RNA 2',3'-cyclic 3'-phosphodiesterase